MEIILKRTMKTPKTFPRLDYLYKKNDRLTKTFRKIFGKDSGGKHIVDTAYYVVFNLSDPERIKKHELETQHCIRENASKIINYSHIMIKLVNGKMVNFSSSDWAFIANPSLEEFIECKG